MSHRHTSKPRRLRAMITSKSTKAEILAAYRVAASRPPVTWGDVPDLIARTARTVADETVILIKDCYSLGVWCRKQTRVIQDEIRPLLNLIP